MAQASHTPTATHTNRNIAQIQEALEAYTEGDAEVESDEALTNLWSAVKNLEDAAETLRKEVVEPELEGRVPPGERLCGVQRIESHRKYITEDPGTVIGRAVARGIDYTDFVSVKASTLADTHPGLANIERNEYTYFQ